MTNIVGQGYRLQRGTATGAVLPIPSADTFTDVIDVEELVLPEATRENEEWNVLDQVASKKRVGPVSWSDCTAKVTRAFQNVVHDSLEDDAKSAGGTRRNWRIIASDPSNETRDFVGFVNKFALNAITNKSRVIFDLGIAVDGDVTINR